MRVVRAVPLALVAGAAVAMATVQPPTPEDPIAQVSSFEVAPGARAVACPGPLVVPVGDIDSGDPDLDSGSEDRELYVLPQAGAPLGEGRAVDLPVATSIERVGGGDIAGLAALNCPVPLREQWLVGGSTALGSSARLVLSNPSDGAVRVQIDLYGATGNLGNPVSVTVGPQAQQERLIEGLEAEVPVIAVRLRAGGVGIAAALQDSRLDGFTAAGTDWVGPAPLPDTSLVVPVAGPSSESAPALLRVMAPDGADVAVTLIGPEGPLPWLGESTVAIEPDTVTDIPIPAENVVAVEIEASAPVTASSLVRVARDATSGSDGAIALDHTWTPAQIQGGSQTRALVMPRGQTEVVIYSPRDQRFVLTADDGAEVLAVDLEARTVVSLPLAVDPGIMLTADSDATWAVVARDVDAGFLTSVMPEPTERLPVTVDVSVGPYASRP